MKFKTALTSMTITLSFFATAAMAGPEWNYAEQSRWGSIEDTSPSLAAPLDYPYAECSIGKHQSPVDVENVMHLNELNELHIRYPEDMPDFFNSGHAVQVNSSSAYKGVLKIGDDLYPLIQYHFHSPSEHSIGTKTFPAELHFVHIRKDGRMAVLGVFLEEGEANSTVQAILDSMGTNVGEHNPNTGIEIKPSNLLPHNRSQFYTYAGSLTTPPCSEGVNWYLLSQPVTVSHEQLLQLQSFYSDNARPHQALNGRVVASGNRS